MKKKYGLVLVSILLLVSIAFSLSGCGQVKIPSTEGSTGGRQETNTDFEGNISAVNLMAGFVSTLTGDKREIDENFIRSQMELSLKLFKASANENSGKNVLVSPLSIQLALAMNANGAKGTTKSEMEALLGNGAALEELNEYLNSYVQGLPSEEKYKLEIANSIWFRSFGFTPNEEFLQANKNYYDSDVYSAPFDKSTVNDINSWVTDKTDGMINKAIEDIPSNAIMYLINAIMFDAEWANKYNEYSILNGKFTSESGEEEDAEMMHSSEYLYVELENAKGFKKQYKDGKYSFVALLPNEDVDITSFVNTLEAEALLGALANQSYENIYAIMPKFSYEFEINLNRALSSLGMSTAFDSENADFSGIGEASGNIYITGVTHKTYIAVDEAGTRAGAVTIVEDGAESEPEIPITIELNRPFLFMIVDNATNLPIFIGTLTSLK